MVCPTVEIVGKRIILLSGYRRFLNPRSGKRKSISIEIEAVENLRKSANENPDAVAFGYVAGRWIPAA
jgi:hypothetical protein